MTGETMEGVWVGKPGWICCWKTKGENEIFGGYFFFDHRLSTEALSESFGVCRHGFVIPVL